MSEIDPVEDPLYPHIYAFQEVSANRALDDGDCQQRTPYKQEMLSRPGNSSGTIE
jgi:hypothetical protein